MTSTDAILHQDRFLRQTWAPVVNRYVFFLPATTCSRVSESACEAEALHVRGGHARRRPARQPALQAR
jgi:hypothetical protein